MGNGLGKITVCFTGDTSPHHHHRRGNHDISLFMTDPLDEGLGHSFCYVRPDPTRISSSKVHSEETTTFKTISGASVSANTSTPLSTALIDLYSYNSIDRAAAFESSTSFASIPLQPIPRTCFSGSGPIVVPGSGPLERGFMSGPIERGFMSGPLDHRSGMFSGPIDRDSSLAADHGHNQFARSFSHGGAFAYRRRSRKERLISVLRRAISKTINRGQNSIVAPIKGFGLTVKDHEWGLAPEKSNGHSHSQHHKHNENLTISSLNLSSEGSLDDDDSLENQNLQWAQGKAGEDRVHVVVSEEHGWVFVGIYDGFNGPDAPDYLLSNLYSAVHKELKGLLWDENFERPAPATSEQDSADKPAAATTTAGGPPEEPDCPCGTGHDHRAESGSDLKKRRKRRSSYHDGAAKKWEDNQRRWRCEWDRERAELDRRLKEQLSRSGSDSGSSINHGDVLKALSEALRKTEESYLDIADKMVAENPELALMGSCVLVMLMKGEDVYLMNVGDSRAVLARRSEPDYWLGSIRQDLERINEETLHDLESPDGYGPTLATANLSAFQLTKEHSTSVEEEVKRIRDEHPDDSGAMANDRVKGSLKVTRAFGAGFLKQPKWNNALLEMFRIDYVGKSPYINCVPFLYHHRLGLKDRFLILSSDGLYQYFTNDEAVSEVELFITLQPEGDPAQHLVEEVLFRAAKKAGMDFHELLEIPQGDRRRYHDDVSIIVISLEGRIWRSCV